MRNRHREPGVSIEAGRELFFFVDRGKLAPSHVANPICRSQITQNRFGTRQQGQYRPGHHPSAEAAQQRLCLLPLPTFC